MSNGDIIKLADDMVDCGDMQKILLTYPHVEDSVIPSSLEPVEFGLDKTGSWNDLLQLLESNKTKTDYESTSIDKIHLAKQKAKQLGISKIEAMQMVGY